MKAPAPNKLLGQHYLVNDGVIDKIVQKVWTQSAEGQRPVVEIGPGPGALTRALLARKLRVTAIEKDLRMVEKLRHDYPPDKFPNFRIVEGDALRVPVDEIFRNERTPGGWVLCGNLPYNVGTEILFRFLEGAPEIESFICMHQKEVVLRLMSRGGSKDYGLPSLKWAWAVDFLDHFWVNPGSFSPPPKVDSGVFVARRRAQPLANPLERDGLYDEVSDLARRAFVQRRKMLRSAYAQLKDHEWGTLRPEALSPEDFLRLPDLLRKQ